MAPRETIVIDANPPAYPGGYGTIESRSVEVHHHHHHTLRARDQSSACCRTLLVVILVLFIVASFGIVTFVAWNYHEVAECEKQRLPWEKPCKDWLGKGQKDWLGRSAVA